MKKILLLVILAFITQLPSQAQILLQTNYAYGSPQGEMALNIRQSHGVTGKVLYQLPKSPIAVGLELGYAGYGSQTTKQQYQLSNGQELETDVNVFNSITNAQLVTQVNLLSAESKLNPYIQGTMGISVYNTELTIEDPRANHTSECPVPLETDILSRDAAFIGSIGAGARYNIAELSTLDHPFNIYLDMNVRYTFGSNVDYMSVKPPNGAQSTNGQDVNIAFASEAQPEIVTEYHVGNLYSTSVEFLEMSIGIGVSF